jgi:hypothetical protein
MEREGVKLSFYREHHKQLFVAVVVEVVVVNTSNNRSNWNHLKILQKILEQRTGKARYQGTAENSCTGHSTHCGKC